MSKDSSTPIRLPVLVAHPQSRGRDVVGAGACVLPLARDKHRPWSRSCRQTTPAATS